MKRKKKEHIYFVFGFTLNGNGEHDILPMVTTKEEIQNVLSRFSKFRVYDNENTRFTQEFDHLGLKNIKNNENPV